MGCCISYSQISDKDLMSAIPESTTKLHCNRRKQAKHLQTRRLKREEMGNRVKDNERSNNRKTTSSNAPIENSYPSSSNQSFLSEELKMPKMVNEIQSKREKIGSKNEEFEQPTHHPPPGWYITKMCFSYTSYDFNDRVPSSHRLSTTSASDPVQIVDLPDIDEQARPNINIVPIAPPPPVLPI